MWNNPKFGHLYVELKGRRHYVGFIFQKLVTKDGKTESEHGIFRETTKDSGRKVKKVVRMGVVCIYIRNNKETRNIKRGLVSMLSVGSEARVHTARRTLVT